MPAYDLSTANVARVANQEVDMLMIANEVVWQKPTISYSIFTTQVPTGDAFVDGNGLSLGTVFFSSVDGTVDGIRYYTPNQNEPGRKGALWFINSESNGTQRGPTLDLNPLVDSGWNVDYFPTPIPIDANVRYCISVFYPNYYAATPGFFATGEGSTVPGITNGPLTSPPTDWGSPGFSNGRFHEGSSIAFPDSTFQGGCYFVDVIFTPS